MADMTKKHFTLIEDAIKKGVADLSSNESFRRQLSPTGEAGNVDPHKLKMAQAAILNSLGESFAYFLRFTSDGFKADEFKRGIRTLQ